MFYTNEKYSLTQKTVTSALLLSVSFALKILSFSIPIAGVAAIRVGFGSSFLYFIGILFGPVYGAIAGAVYDVVGYLMNPLGAFLWPLTLVAFLKGFSIAFLWHFIKKINFKFYNFVYLFIFIGILALGLFNLAFIYFFADSTYTQLIMGIGERTEAISVGISITGFIGILLHLVAWFLLYRSKKIQLFERYLKLLICVGVPALFFTTVNTVILMEVFSIKIPFVYFWIPRLIEEIFITLFNTYVLITLMSVYENIFKINLTKGEVLDDEKTKTDL